MITLDYSVGGVYPNDHMGGEGVTQMIANDHRGEGGVWEGPKYDRAILE